MIEKPVCCRCGKPFDSKGVMIFMMEDMGLPCCHACNRKEMDRYFVDRLIESTKEPKK